MLYFEVCPNCNSDDVSFNRKKNFLRCEECGFNTTSDEKQAEITPEISHSTKLRIDSLPFPLALCLYEYARETSPYLRLHRLTDAAEMLTRFLTIIALSDILRLEGEFPDKLKEELTKKLELPTFGAWKELLRVTVSLLEERNLKSDCFVTGLPDYANKTLLPLLGGNDGSPEQQIIPLRNLLAHQGRFSDIQAVELLAKHQARFERLFHEPDFLKDYELIACIDEAALVHLRGLPQDSGAFPAYTNQADFIQSTPESVYLLHNGQALNLFPLQIFGAVLHWRDDLTEPEKILEATPQIYFRFGRKGQLDFTPLTGEAIFAHQRGAVLESFNQIFSLEEWRKTIAGRKGMQTSAFDDLLRELLAVFVGREKDVKIAKEKLKESSGGFLWISGQPGVGKSSLMAKLIDDYQNSTHHFVFPYLFRLGHTGCSVDSFLKMALARLYKAVDQPMNLGAHIEERCTLFINLVRKASQTLDKKIWFLIDGLDEIYRLDKSFLSLPFAASGERVVWLCAGRNEPLDIEDSLRRQGAEWIFPEGLGVLDEQGVRTMLLEHLDRLKFPLLERDKQKTRQTADVKTSIAEQSDSEWSNEFTDTLTRRSEGLPLYVRMAIDDLQTGKLSVSDEKKLPEGLSAYFEQILERLRISDVGTVLTPLFCLLAWAKEPITEAALQELMSGHHLSKTSRWQESFQNALRHGHLMLRQELTPEGDYGWTFYHDSFRQHLQSSVQIKDNREWAQSEWLNKCSQWQTVPEKSLHIYALRQYATHLQEARKWEGLLAIARNLSFRLAQEHAFPQNPELTLQPLNLALQSAMEIDDTLRMAELVIKHARQVARITTESPLDALKKGSFQRALQIADLYTVEWRLWWYLLLSSELKEKGRIREAKETLERLLVKTLPYQDENRIGFRTTELVLLIAETKEVDKDVFEFLQKNILDDIGRRNLCGFLSSKSSFKDALEITKSIYSEMDRAFALLRIAEDQFKCNKPADAKLSFSETKRVARKANYTEKIITLRDCAIRQADLGLLNQARRGLCSAAKTAASSYYLFETGILLSDIAMNQAELGFIDDAYETWSMLREDDLSFETNEAIKSYMYLFFEKDVTYAINSANSFRKSQICDSLLNGLASFLSRESNLNSIQSIIQLINNERDRNEVLKKISSAFCEHGNAETALKVAMMIKKIKSRDEALLQIALAKARKGDFDSALHLVETIKDREELKSFNLKLAYEYRNQGLNKNAEECLLKVLSLIQTSQNSIKQLDEFFQLSYAYYLIGNSEKSRSILALGIQLANRIDESTLKTETLSKIEKVRNIQETSQVIQKQRMIENIIDFCGIRRDLEFAGGYRHFAKGDVVKTYLSLPHDLQKTFPLALVAIEKAVSRDFESAETIAKLIKNLSYRAELLYVISIAQIEAGHLGEACKNLHTALRIGSFYSDHWFIKFARALFLAGDTIAAYNNFIRAVHIALEKLNIADEEYTHAFCDLIITGIKLGFGDQSVKFVNYINIDKEIILPQIASEFVELKDYNNFKALLFDSAYYLETSYQMCGLLARLYPRQVDALISLINHNFGDDYQ